MDSPLPQEVQRIILNNAELPIDTYLHFKKQLELVPKKLSCSTELIKKLNIQYGRRAKFYAAKNKFERLDPSMSSAHDYFYRKFDNTYSVEIIVDFDKDDSKMKIAMRIMQSTEDEMWTLRKTIADLNTGELVDDFYDDSDDDVY
jgi:hypothetical protein